MPIAEQTRQAIAWTWRNAERLGGDPDRLFVSAPPPAPIWRRSP